jgi:hypothetical protein
MDCPDYQHNTHQGQPLASWPLVVNFTQVQRLSHPPVLTTDPLFTPSLITRFVC